MILVVISWLVVIFYLCEYCLVCIGFTLTEPIAVRHWRAFLLVITFTFSIIKPLV